MGYIITWFRPDLGERSKHFPTLDQAEHYASILRWMGFDEITILPDCSIDSDLGSDNEVEYGPHPGWREDFHADG